MVRATPQVPPGRRGERGGTTLLMACAVWIGYFFALAFPRRACDLSSSLAPLHSALFARGFFPSSFRAILSLASAAIFDMSSLSHPRRYQRQAQLDVVRRFLGWTMLELARKIRSGSSSLDDLVAGEFVLFSSYASCGLALPISPFFLLHLEEFGLQLQHLTPPTPSSSWRCSST